MGTRSGDPETARGLCKGSCRALWPSSVLAIIVGTDVAGGLLRASRPMCGGASGALVGCQSGGRAQRVPLHSASGMPVAARLPVRLWCSILLPPSRHTQSAPRLRSSSFVEISPSRFSEGGSVLRTRRRQLDRDSPAQKADTTSRLHSSQAGSHTSVTGITHMSVTGIR
jgi:hypothetical protein